MEKTPHNKEAGDDLRSWVPLPLLLFFILEIGINQACF